MPAMQNYRVIVSNDAADDLNEKTLPIMNHKWTVVFHIDGDFVIIDRFIPSKLMVD